MTRLRLTNSNEIIKKVEAIKIFREVTGCSLSDASKAISSVISGKPYLLSVEDDKKIDDIIKQLSDTGLNVSISDDAEEGATEKQFSEEGDQEELTKTDKIIDKIYKFHSDLFEKNEKVGLALLGVYLVILIGLFIYDYSLAIGAIALIIFTLGWREMSKDERSKIKSDFMRDGLKILKGFFKILKVIAVIAIILAVIFLPPSAIFKIVIIALIIFFLF